MRLDLRAGLVHGAIRLLTTLGGGRCTAGDARRDVENWALRPQSWAPPRRMANVHVDVDHHAGFPVYTIHPRSPSAEGRGRVLYFHGGGYICEISAHHWRFARDVARRSGVAVVVPIYPLAPVQTAQQTVDQAASLLGEASATGEPLVVMGDSAGGGLALAAVQHLRRTGGARPKRLVLIAPWLDATFSYPDQMALGRRDHILRVDYLAEAGRMFAGGLDVRDPRVSPLFADATGLPPISLFVGGHDLLLPDSRRLRDAAMAAGVAVRYTEEPHMQHTYPILPMLRQAAVARAQIAADIVASLEDPTV